LHAINEISPLLKLAFGFRADDELSEELQGIFTSMQKCLLLRKKYMEMSLQCPGDNPKDSDSWKIYPAPPKPSYPPQKGVKIEIEPENEEFVFEKAEIPGYHEVDLIETARKFR
jgi:AMP deaminase